jgi:DNA-binding response OmpR family regulator
MRDRFTLDALQREFKRPALASARSTVLVAAEDAVRTLIVELLWLDGHHVSTAETESGLLDALRSFEDNGLEPPDVFIVDGRIAGRECLQALVRLRERAPKTCLLFVAAPDNEGIRREAARLGGMVFDKPVDLDDLRTVVLSMPKQKRNPRS